MINLSFFSFWILLSGLYTTTGTLSIEMENIASRKGTILIAIFDQEEDFKNQEQPIYEKEVSVNGKEKLSVSIPDLPFGKYSIATFHDLNDNKELDRNTLGIPSEPYAFSNNPTAKWKAPKFKESLFHFAKDQQTIMLELKHWRDR